MQVPGHTNTSTDICDTQRTALMRKFSPNERDTGEFHSAYMEELIHGINVISLFLNYSPNQFMALTPRQVDIANVHQNAEYVT